MKLSNDTRSSQELFGITEPSGKNGTAIGTMSAMKNIVAKQLFQILSITNLQS